MGCSQRHLPSSEGHLIRRFRAYQARAIGGSGLIPHARVAFDQMGADVHRDDAREVLEWLRRKDLRSFTRRQALRDLQGRFPNVATLKPALELLADHGWIRDVERSASPGRPSIAYEVTPYLHTPKTEETERTQHRQSPESRGFVGSVSNVLEASFRSSPSLCDATAAGGLAGVVSRLTAANLGTGGSTDA